MPKELEDKLKREARSKGLSGDRANAYVYGTLRKTGWKPSRETHIHGGSTHEVVQMDPGANDQVIALMGHEDFDGGIDADDDRQPVACPKADTDEYVGSPQVDTLAGVHPGAVTAAPRGRSTDSDQLWPLQSPCYEPPLNGSGSGKATSGVRANAGAELRPNIEPPIYSDRLGTQEPDGLDSKSKNDRV